jgi:serine/threonine protein phosphatase PrpC
MRPVGARGVLLGVCDGIGGHHAGEIASFLALETLEKEMRRLSGACPRAELFKKAVEVVNQRVWAEASLHPDSLVALANERGGEDNITVVIARVS